MISENSDEAQEALGPFRLKPLDGFEGTLSNRVYQSLRDAILTLEYKPGQILRKQEVCEALNVSRSPVSEAIANAKAYLTDTLRHAFPVGTGHGPVNHLFGWWAGAGSEGKGGATHAVDRDFDSGSPAEGQK